MLRSGFVLVAVGASLLAASLSNSPVSAADKLCIVIDPGHGGRDNGSMSTNGLKEKDVVLDIAQRLRILLSSTRPDARVVLTRRHDYYVSLDTRANQANRAKDGAPADLLISIHANACMGPSVNGFEVFYASKRHEFDLDEIIQLEDAIQVERGIWDDGLETAEGSRWDSLYRKHDEANKLLASSVAAALEERLAMPNLLVAPAVLRLLRGLDMPAVLVEIGFLSSPAGEAVLGSEDFKDTCALALLEGIRAHLDEMSNRARSRAWQPAAQYGSED